MSGPKHTPYPEWVEEAVRDHYDRIAEGAEDEAYNAHLLEIAEAEAAPSEVPVEQPELFGGAS